MAHIVAEKNAFPANGTFSHTNTSLHDRMFLNLKSDISFVLVQTYNTIILTEQMDKCKEKFQKNSIFFYHLIVKAVKVYL